MQRFYTLYILLFFTFSVNDYLFAQTKPENIKLSDSIVVIEGKKLLIHKVKQGETIYAISKAYSVDEKTLKNENPDLSNILKLDMELKIPVNKDNYKTIVDEYIYHTVEKGETIWFLSKKYNVKEKDIIQNNKEAEKGLREGEIIKIPNPEYISKSVIKVNETIIKTTKKDNDITKNDNIKIDKNIKSNGTIKDTSKYIYYKVQKKQTLFYIAKKYNVEIDDIHRANPELSKTGLKPDMIILIPKTKPITHEEIESLNNIYIKPKSKIDTIINTNTGLLNENVNCDNYYYNKNPITFKVALLLPFYTDAITIQKEIAETNNDKEDENEKIALEPKPFFEFYEGVLMAIDTLKKSGLNVDLYVYDSRRDSVETRAIIQKKEMKQMDLIIGPVFYPNIQIVADFAKKNKINFVSPLSSNDDILNNNPYCFQVNTTIETQIEQCAKFYAGYKNKSIIVVHNGTEAELEIIKTFKNKLFNSYSENNNSNNIIYKEVLYTKTGIAGVEEAFSKTDENLVILPSSNQVFILNMITSLNSLSKTYKISILGFPSWKKFENNLELEYIHNLEMKSFTPYFVNYNDSITNIFINKYRNIYNAEPTKYSYCGYDIGYYFLTALKKYGKNLQNCITNYNVELLQTSFYFNRNSKQSGFENKSVYILSYEKDFDVKKINKVTYKLEKPIIDIILEK